MTNIEPMADVVEMSADQLLERFNQLMAQRENADTCTTYSGKIQEIGALFCDNRAIVRVVLSRPAPSEASGLECYKTAFYEIADMLDIPAQTISPKEVFETQIKPRILTALTTAHKARDEALEEAAKVAEGEKYTQAYSDASYSAGDQKPQIYNDACDDVAQAIRSLKGAAK